MYYEVYTLRGGLETINSSYWGVIDYMLSRGFIFVDSLSKVDTDTKFCIY